MVYCSIMLLPIGHYKSIEGEESLAMSRGETLPTEVVNTIRSIHEKIRPTQSSGLATRMKPKLLSQTSTFRDPSGNGGRGENLNNYWGRQPDSLRYHAAEFQLSIFLPALILGGYQDWRHFQTSKISFCQQGTWFKDFSSDSSSWKSLTVSFLDRTWRCGLLFYLVRVRSE